MERKMWPIIYTLEDRDFWTIGSRKNKKNAKNTPYRLMEHVAKDAKHANQPPDPIGFQVHSGTR